MSSSISPCSVRASATASPPRPAAASCSLFIVSATRAPNAGSTTFAICRVISIEESLIRTAPGPSPGTRGVQRLSLIGWWQAWQSNRTSSGNSPSWLRFGSASTAISSDTAIAWPIAHTCTPSQTRLRFS